MRNSTDPAQPSAPSSPLARDEDGRPIRLPEEAAAWRIRRHTRGRPRHQLDANKQPMVFPLSYTLNDAEEILPPGTYRLDLIDAGGKFLEITVPITVGLRNAEADDEPAVPERTANENVSASLPATTSDVRLVLEANVRSTQLAFQHHERMAETLRDGIRVLADAQADILKSFASARGFLRNSAAPQQLVLPPSKPADDDEDEDDDEEDEDDSAPPQDDRLMAFGMAAMTLVNNLMETFKAPKAAAGTPGPQKSVDFMKYLDWRRAVPKPPEEPTQPALPKLDINEPVPPAELMRLGLAVPPEMRGKLAAARARFTPDEEKRLLWLITAIDPAELPQILAELSTKSVDELVTLFRSQLAKVAA
jgi:hypothetical protein